MHITGSDPVLAVHDLARSATWFADVLGCEISEPDPGNWTFCAAGPFSMTLQTFPAGRRGAEFTARDDGSMSVDHSC